MLSIDATRERLRGYADKCQRHARRAYQWSAGGVIVAAILYILQWIGLGNRMALLLKMVWWCATVIGPWMILFAVGSLLVFTHWDQISRKLFGPTFEIRPIPGESLHRRFIGPNSDVIARLAIKNVSGKLRTRCCVRLMEASPIMHGMLLSAPQFRPSINPDRGETFLLRWSNNESSTNDRRYLDIPSDGAERTVDCLIVDQQEHGFAAFCAADPDDLKDRCGGIGRPRSWWKLRVRVASDDGASADIELVAACADRDPGPIDLDFWHPRGETILAEQLVERQSAKRPATQKPAG